MDLVPFACEDDQNHLVPSLLLKNVCPEMLSAFYVCCIHSDAFQNTFIMEANTMDPDLPKGAV